MNKDLCSLTSVRRIAAMLDIAPETVNEGAILPRGWHFFMLAGDTQKSKLRADGFPGFGLPMPELGFPRLLLGGRNVNYLSDILIGDSIERFSKIVKIDKRETSAIVTLSHELHANNVVAIVETQTYILLPNAKPVSPPASQPVTGYSITPDATMLFHYSALGFNSHKIHLDRAHAREVEGLPDLVVNGGLVMLLALEYLRTELGITPQGVKTRHTAPLYCDRAITFILHEHILTAYDDAGNAAMTMEISL
jgi:3-methylfumaryl-CoA hydratase